MSNNKCYLKYISKKISPISILFLGLEGYQVFNSIQIKEPTAVLKYFNNAEFFIIRNNWTNKTNYLIMDFGKFGAHKAGHTHFSISNFIYCYKCKEIIVDSGTYSYNRFHTYRNYFRGS